MAQVLKGHLHGEDMRIGIVVARFNEHITSKLLEGALEGLKSHGVASSDIVVVWVPGSFELASIAERLAQQGDFDAVICLGAVVKHETDHYYYVATEAARGIASVARESEVPVIFGVLTCENDQQALERAGGKEGNKGTDAALAAIEMANLLKLVDELR
ncbi:MAG: 6,7-dimethyl-8-ribityllumazine synthase [Chloroflexi bacterium]|nr:6,7-dimethyl-8-ribityllumazine synthase [Chloroflexota bacterium]